MFRWYRSASICYAFLSDVPTGDNTQDPRSAFYSSRWFQRGWTLQELLAQPIVRFYDWSWHYLGTKVELCEAIEEVAGIPSPSLLGIAELQTASVAQRMSWAARRLTKRKEDIAYCLLGIFDTNMPMIYGEGSRAFRRLQEQIIRDIGDDSILAWRLNPEGQASGPSSADIAGRVFARNPSAFENCSNIVSRERPGRDSFDMRSGKSAPPPHAAHKPGRQDARPAEL